MIKRFRKSLVSGKAQDGLINCWYLKTYTVITKNISFLWPSVLSNLLGNSEKIRPDLLQAAQLSIHFFTWSLVFESVAISIRPSSRPKPWLLQLNHRKKPHYEQGSLFTRTKNCLITKNLMRFNIRKFVRMSRQICANFKLSLNFTFVLI